jgi:hypothetical protein
MALKGLDGMINNPEYTHYVVVWRGDGKRKIESGWSFREDAKDRFVEIVDVEAEGVGPFQDASAKVVSKSALRRMNLDAEEDRDWFSPGTGLGILDLKSDKPFGSTLAGVGGTLAALTFQRAAIEKEGGAASDLFVAGTGMLFLGVGILSKDRNLAPALLALVVAGIVISSHSKVETKP